MTTKTKEPDLKHIPIDEIIRSHQGHYFSTDTMRAFKSKVYEECAYRYKELLGLFITSERNSGFGEFTGTPRKFSVKGFNFGTGQVFNIRREEFDSKTQAERFLRDIIRSNGLLEHFEDFCRTTIWLNKEMEKVKALKAVIELKKDEG